MAEEEGNQKIWKWECEKEIQLWAQEEDILVVLGSPEFLDYIFGITDHRSDFLWLWWRTQLPDLHFFFILERDEKQSRRVGNRLRLCAATYNTEDTLKVYFDSLRPPKHPRFIFCPNIGLNWEHLVSIVVQLISLFESVTLWYISHFHGAKKILSHLHSRYVWCMSLTSERYLGLGGALSTLACEEVGI